VKTPPLFLLVCLSVVTALPAAPRPNIILAMADDMGWGDPGYNSTTVLNPPDATHEDWWPHPDQGWISTPTMDTMAANGLRFDRFYSASAVCSPTRASCLTGRNPFRIGVPTANSGRLGFDETPLSEVLSDQGYLCGHFGKWHLGSLTTLRADSNRGGNAGVYSGPWHHAYDSCFCTESKVPTYHPYRKANNNLPLPVDFADSNFYGTRYWRMPATWNQTSGEGDVVPAAEINDATNGDDSKILVDQAIPFIQAAVAAGEPFFVVLWFHTPHKPVVDPEGVSGVDSSDAGRDSIEDLDTALGRVRAELTTLGVRGNTMFWVTSDNGPENGVNSFNESSTVRSIRSGRFLERKRSLHEGGLRVPGILEWPDVITSGMTTDFPAVTSDYYPTILDYLCLGIPGQKPLDGISLRPVIEGTATTRTKPIGFKFSGDKSWVNQRYKLIDDDDDGDAWELYDLLNIPAGEEVEQTPTATAANIASQPQPIQDIYNTMLAEFTAWDAAVGADTPYVHTSQPTVTLGTPSTDVTEPFTVTATFSEDVSELNAGEFSVTNGTASGLTGSGTTWMLTISPAWTGTVTIDLPEGCAIDPDGNPNAASNSLTVNYTDPEDGPATIVSSTVSTLAGQTVDNLGNVPGNQDNNELKFTAGTTNDGVANPYTTTLYVRSSGVDLRKVRAFVRFDLSGFSDHPVASADLSFNGHSLNDQNAVDIEVVPLGADWSETGTPLPTFDHLTVGSAVNGGSIIAGLAPGDHTRDYTFDVTPAVRNWLDGTWPNHGLQIRLTSTTENNGVGIKTSGAGAIQLLVDQAPLIATGISTGAPDPYDLAIRWNSAPDVGYRIETSLLLQGDWIPLDDVPGSGGTSTVFIHENGLGGPPSRFYRVRHLPGPPPAP